MKKQIVLVLAVAACLVGCNAKKTSKNNSIKDSLATAPVKEEATTIQEQYKPDLVNGSIKSQAIGKLGDVEIKISYYSPAVRGRIIWGGLVPFNKVWVTGAHSSTSIEVNRDLVIGDKTVPAGKYAFFTIPGKEDRTIIMNKNWRQHLTKDIMKKKMSFA